MPRGGFYDFHKRKQKGQTIMGMKQIMELKHRTRGGEREVFLSRGPHRGWVRQSFLISWLKSRGLWRDEALV